MDEPFSKASVGISTPKSARNDRSEVFDGSVVSFRSVRDIQEDPSVTSLFGSMRSAAAAGKCDSLDDGGADGLPPEGLPRAKRPSPVIVNGLERA